MPKISYYPDGSAPQDADEWILRRAAANVRLSYLQLHTALAALFEAAGAIAAHEAAGDPHPIYLRLVEADLLYAALLHAHAISDVTGLQAALDLKVPATRAVNTSAPLTGGGDLSADRTLGISDFVGSGATHARGAVPDPGVTAGTTKFLREDATWAVPPSGSFTVTEVELDFGATALHEKEFTITDAAVSGASKLLMLPSSAAPTSRDVDEPEMEAFECRCRPGSGQFAAFISSLEGRVEGKYKFNYSVG